jgi:hypothetical protein
MYTIRYTTGLPMAVNLNALTAEEALRICEGLVERGHSPTIEKDGVEYDLAELQRAVGRMRFGEDK